MNLLGDIGGTNTRFLLEENDRAIHEALYPSRDFSEPLAVIDKFLAEIGHTRSQLDAVLLAVAGPVLGDKITLTNVGWSFSQSDTQRQLGGAALGLMNDNAAVAMALPTLKPEDVVAICQAKVEPNGVKVALGCGTGVGAAAFVPLPYGGGQAIGAEFGHTAIAAFGAREAEMIARVGKLLAASGSGFVTAEHVASATALSRLHRAARETFGQPASEAYEPAQIVQAAHAGDEVARYTTTMFTKFLASFAQNVALAYLPTGGLYLHGGIFRRLGDLFDEERFCRRFLENPTMRSVLEGIPVVKVKPEIAAYDGLRAMARAKASPSTCQP